MADAKLCAVSDCGKGGKLTRGWCQKHYQRWQVHGDPVKSLYDRDGAGGSCRHAGCGKLAVGKGLCRNHYMMLKARGTTEHHDRFRRRIRWIEEHAAWDGDGCLLWPFGVNEMGRGQLSYAGRQMSAPRVMCIIAHGPPPTPAHEAAHSCGMGHKGCVNPRHLRWATRSENIADQIEHGTLRRGSAVNTSKLTPDDVRAIRARDGETGAAVAADYGVSPSAIWAIWNGVSWAWLE